jgi:outer membrane lipoprotein-sorting protein
MRISNRVRAGVLVTVVAIAVAFAGTSALRANPAPVLPAVAPAQLLASTLDALAGPVTISGDVTTEADLGLPDLPAGLGGDSSGPASLMIGQQRFKVWLSPDGARVARLLPFDEQDVVANRTDAWIWDSAKMTAAHLSLAALPAPKAPAARVAQVSPPSTADVLGVARQVLRAVQPYAEVSVDGTARVAGRPVYQLTLTPRSPLTRIGRIVVAVDSQTLLPLRLQVFARGAEQPAFVAGFTKVSFDPIDASTFQFTPPPGATVTQIDPAKIKATASSNLTQITGLKTFGGGFDLRWAMKLSGPLPAEAAALLPYAGPLASAETVEHDGATWLLFGFVDLPTLQLDAGRLP